MVGKLNIKTKPCRKITTIDPKTKKFNGWLLELVSDADGFTKHLRGQMYLTVAAPGQFKGYHLHVDADYFVTCLKGKVKEIIYKNHREYTEIEMGDRDFKTVFLPKGNAHGILNTGKEPAYILIYRYPSWSADIKEQFDIPQSQVKDPAIWREAKKFAANFKKSRKKII